MKAAREKIFASVKKVEKWLEEHQYKGYDPADGLTSYLRPLTFGHLFLSRLLQQFIWRSPINLRPLLGVRPLNSFIGCGYIARAYLLMFGLTGDSSYRQKASSCLNWLIQNRAPGYDHYCWGKMFDFASRAGWQEKYGPITVWTSLIGQAFIDAYEIIGDRKYLAVARSVCEWILGVPRSQTSSGSCISYTPSKEGEETIHNQSVLAAAMLARTARYSLNTEYLRMAHEAIEYTCTRQRPNGSWYYGEESKYHWIDNFHTGYILDSLKSYIELTNDTKHEETLRRGFSFYRNNFIEKNGRPKYYDIKTFPVDSQCVSQTIDTLANFADHDDTSLELAVRVAIWAVDNMQDPSGFFYFRRYPYIVNRTPMIHWAQSTTYKALASLLSRM